MNLRRLLAVDPSLTCSGWACFGIRDGAVLAVGKMRSLPASLPLSARLEDLQLRIISLIKQLELAGEDVMVCEAPTTMRDPSAALKVEQVRCIFESVARFHNMRVPGRINPRSVHLELLGLRGRQRSREVVKQLAVGVVDRLYGGVLSELGFADGVAELLKHQDIVDALLLGTLALTNIRSAFSAGLTLEDFFMRKPTSRRGRVAQGGVYR